MHLKTSLSALLLLVTGLAACTGEQPRYDAAARAADPALTLADPDPATETDMPNEPATQDDDARAQRWADYNAALLADKVELTDDEWRAILSDEEYRILRQSGTEWRGTGRYLDNEEDGTYHCAGCGLFLYDAAHKFHSGCGWPSFNQEVADGVLTYVRDTSAGMVRTEMRCARCDGHMGHVFNDAPDQPTGLRHCVNGGAVLFIPEGKDPQQAITEHRAAHADQ